MDHLPHPGNSAPLDVPFLSRASPLVHVNHGETHTTFPSEHNYRSGASFHDRTSLEIASFAQDFLFFGLLTDILQCEVDPNLFLVNKIMPDGIVRRTLSLRNLKELIVSFKLQHSDKFDSDRVGQLILDASVNLTHLERIRSPIDEPLPSVLLSIGILIETLSYVLLPHWRVNEGALTPLLPGDRHETMTSWLLESRMRERGWCPAQIRQALCMFPYSLSYYLSGVRRHPRQEGEHGNCSAQRCKAYDIDHGKYIQAHAPNCDKECGVVGFGEEVSELVALGKIPVLYIKRSPDGTMSLGVKESSYNDNYVAVSHVWSDGLGNEIDNTMPRCQLERISGYISDLPRAPAGLNIAPTILFRGENIYVKPKLFWIDTLCVPQPGPTPDPKNPPDQELEKRHAEKRRLRKLAINTMPAVYAGAAQVLVLDGEMEQINGTDVQWPEIAGKLLLSAWAGRSWTLEEAGFSNACRVRIADGYFDPKAAAEHREFIDIFGSNSIVSKELWKAVARSVRNGLYDLLWPNPKRTISREFDTRLSKMIPTPLEDAFDSIFTRGVEKAEELDRMDRLTFVWNSLSNRQTSVPQDKLTIFVHMLDMNPIEVMGAPSARSASTTKDGNQASQDVEQGSTTLPDNESIMKKALMSCDTLPLALLFNKEQQPRTNEGDGYRWLPVSPGGERLARDEVMRWVDGGLHFRNKQTTTHANPPSHTLSLFKLDSACINSDRLVVDGTGSVSQGGLGMTFTNPTTCVVEFCRTTNDRMSREQFNIAAIISEYTWLDSYEFPGACLMVSSASQDCSCRINEGYGLTVGKHLPTCSTGKATLECVYDCPVRIHYIRDYSEPELKEIPKASFTTVERYEVLLKCGSYCLSLIITRNLLINGVQTLKS